MGTNVKRSAYFEHTVALANATSYYNTKSVFLLLINALLHFLTVLVYSIVIKYNRLSGLKQHPRISLQFCWSAPTGLTLKVQECWSPEAFQENPFPCFCQLVETAPLNCGLPSS